MYLPRVKSQAWRFSAQSFATAYGINFSLQHSRHSPFGLNLPFQVSLQFSHSDVSMSVLHSPTSRVLFIQFPFIATSSPSSLPLKILSFLADQSQIPPPLQSTFPDPPTSFEQSCVSLIGTFIFSLALGLVAS